MIKAVIADDIQILRQGLRAILEQDKDIRVVGLAADGREAWQLCRKHRPDVVLMDMRMPEYDGSYGITRIKADYPEIKVLVLTTFDDRETVDAAVGSGADGYISVSYTHLDVYKRQGVQYSQSMMGMQMACAYVGSTFMPPLFGVAAERISVTPVSSTHLDVYKRQPVDFRLASTAFSLLPYILIKCSHALSSLKPSATDSLNFSISP